MDADQQQRLAALADRAKRICASINDLHLNSSTSWTSLLAHFNVLSDHLLTMESKEDIDASLAHCVVQPVTVDANVNISNMLRTKLLPEMEDRESDLYRSGIGAPAASSTDDGVDEHLDEDVTAEHVLEAAEQVRLHNRACMQAFQAIRDAKQRAAQSTMTSSTKVELQALPNTLDFVLDAMILGGEGIQGPGVYRPAANSQ